ncbi:hypothetical protein [Hoeflea prorocentri]|uniref:Uncharacterized protein n=1 Tax=Hoeflea prorocentri TaxID=1922333 RepID=A0A9X3ZFP8_9HYPH|nr:hypothetical protein [Hoeflea prorocentri]MCY6379438.1 hypothetical protein [Hoeflea prorocentri]MDA5397239.1 hypothetical protein [Hoeflea prorocentri]
MAYGDEGLVRLKRMLRAGRITRAEYNDARAGKPNEAEAEEQPSDPPRVRKPALVGLGALAFAALFLVGYFIGYNRDNNATDVASTNVYAQHCLSRWDASFEPLVRAVKRDLSDPASFRHIETRPTPVSSDGTNVFTMEYRAANSYGGMTQESASAIVSNETCRMLTWY